MRALVAVLLVSCAAPTAPVDTDAPASTVYEVYAAPVTFNSLGASSAFCRVKGDVAISGGCLISKQTDIGGIAIQGSYPDRDSTSPDRWSCHASNVSGHPAELTTMVICETSLSNKTN
jgi:hypothetical protein